MGSRVTLWTIVVVLMLLATQIGMAQNPTSASGRWRLKFELLDTPRPITLQDNEGQKQVFWYFRYQVVNDTERDIPWMVSVRVVVDKTREGVAEGLVPGLFYHAEIPEEIADKKVDKEEYINRLRTYYDIDLPLVKKEIMDVLQLHPKLQERDKNILAALDAEKPKSIEEIAKATALSPSEVEAALIFLVINNLALSQEAPGNLMFLGDSPQGAMFLENGQEVAKKAGEKIGDWDVISYTGTQVMLKKGDEIMPFLKGSNLDYLYIKTQKAMVERDTNYLSGMAAKGVYKGRYAGEQATADKVHQFQSATIPKKSIRHGLAIFQDLAQDMDFMAVVVTGLVDPLVRRKGQINLESEVYMIGYAKGGGEAAQEEMLVPLYQRWTILGSKETQRK